jgi:hypothetical protein
MALCRWVVGTSPAPNANPITAVICVDFCNRLIQEKGGEPALVKAIKTACLDSGEFSCAQDMAARQHLSVRTLHRCLAELGYARTSLCWMAFACAWPSNIWNVPDCRSITLQSAVVFRMYPIFARRSKNGRGTRQRTTCVFTPITASNNSVCGTSLGNARNLPLLNSSSLLPVGRVLQYLFQL